MKVDITFGCCATFRWILRFHSPIYWPEILNLSKHTNWTQLNWYASVVHTTQCNSKLYHLPFYSLINPLILTLHLIFLSVFRKNGRQNTICGNYLSQVTSWSESKFPWISNIYKASVRQFVQRCVDLYKLLLKNTAGHVHMNSLKCSIKTMSGPHHGLSHLSWEK